MKTKRARLSVFGCELILIFLLAGRLPAQQAPTAGSAQGQAVPHLVKFSGAVKNADGTPRTAVTGIAFALYKDQAGGAALWLETQNVSLDAQGRYTVLLGANSAEGMPLDAFTANQAQWLGVQPEGLPEQRVLLVSVPYALKAADAETLGGRPASSFVLAAPVAAGGSGNSGSGNSGAGAPGGSSTGGASPAATCATPPCTVMTSGGTANFLSLFTDATTVQDSVLSQSPCPFDASQTCVGITNTNPPLTLFTPTTSPTRVLDVNGEIRVAGGNIFMQRNLTDLVGRRNWAWGTETFNVGDVSLFVSTSNTAFPSVPVFTALSNANMGIGLPTPAAKLDVLGNGNFVASAVGAVALSAQATDATNSNTAISGLADGPSGAGVVGEAENGSLAIGVWGISSSGTAGEFSGNVSVSGTLSAASKNFRIDHPLDPAGKYLYHASVESSEMMNIYTGNTVLDESGAGVVQLPAWFEALNTDFRYQLTAVGGPGPGLYVAQEIQNHSFRIAGGTPGLKVSWQVTGVRQDAFARANPLVVEVEKPERERGYYIHPQLFGQPPTKSIEWAQHPLQMKRAEQSQAAERPK